MYLHCHQTTLNPAWNTGPRQTPPVQVSQDSRPSWDDRPIRRRPYPGIPGFPGIPDHPGMLGLGRPSVQVFQECRTTRPFWDHPAVLRLSKYPSILVNTRLSWDHPGMIGLGRPSYPGIPGSLGIPDHPGIIMGCWGTWTVGSASQDDPRMVWYSQESTI